MQNQPQPQPFSGSVVEPATSGPANFAPPAPGSNVRLTPPTVTSRPDPSVPTKRSHAQLIETILLVIISLIAVTFIGLFVWKYLEWDSVRTDVDGQIDAAVATAVSENTAKLEAEFTEREKYPYKTFTGPSDYGSLSFEYPKTWNALRVTIRTTSFETAIRTYENSVRNGRLTLTTRNIASTIANVYTGQISNDIQGIVAVFKLRDKVVTIQTDANQFSAEYYKLLDTVTFVE